MATASNVKIHRKKTIAFHIDKRLTTTDAVLSVSHMLSYQQCLAAFLQFVNDILPRKNINYKGLQAEYRANPTTDTFKSFILPNMFCVCLYSKCKEAKSLKIYPVESFSFLIFTVILPKPLKEWSKYYFI